MRERNGILSASTTIGDVVPSNIVAKIEDCYLDAKKTAKEILQDAYSEAERIKAEAKNEGYINGCTEFEELCQRLIGLETILSEKMDVVITAAVKKIFNEMPSSEWLTLSLQESLNAIVNKDGLVVRAHPDTAAKLKNAFLSYTFSWSPAAHLDTEELQIVCDDTIIVINQETVLKILGPDVH